MGGRNSRSRSTSEQRDYGTNVWGPQQQYLQDIYSNAQRTYQNYDPSSSYAAANQMEQALNSGMQGLNLANTQYNNANNTLQQAAQGVNAGYGGLNQAGNALTGAYNNIGQGYGALNEALASYRNFLNPGTVNPMMDVYKQQVASNFANNILPQIQGQAAVSGVLGSSRAGIAQGLAAGTANQQLQNFAAELYNQDATRALQATQGISNTGLGFGTLGSQQGAVGQAMTGNALGYGQLGTAMGNIGAQQTALGTSQAQMTPNYANLATGYGGLAQLRSEIPWYALQQYSGIIGDPTIQNLGGTADSKSRSFNRGFGMSTG